MEKYSGLYKKNENNKGEIYIYKYAKAFPYRNSYLLDLTFDVVQNGYFELGEYVKWLNIVYDKLFEMDKSVINEVSRLFDEAYKEIRIRKKNWEPHLLEWSLEFEWNENKFVELRKKYPNSEINTKNYKGKTQKYEIREKLRLDNSSK